MPVEPRAKQPMRALARFLPAPLAVIACVGFISSCGGNADDQRVRDVATKFTLAAGSGDTKECRALLEPTGSLQEAISAGQRTRQHIGAPARRDCGIRGEPASELKPLAIAKVVIQGSEAVVSFKDSPFSMRLRKVHGKWLVDSFA